MCLVWRPDPLGSAVVFCAVGKIKILAGLRWFFAGVFAKSGCFGVVFLWWDAGVLRGERGV
jgi:hypothetical protein